MPRSSQVEPGVKPFRREHPLKLERRDSGCSRRGVMKVPEPWLRRISPARREYLEGLARGDAGNVQGFAEVAFGGQRFLRFPLAGMDRALEIARQLQIGGVGCASSGRRARSRSWAVFMRGSDADCVVVAR